MLCTRIYQLPLRLTALLHVAHKRCLSHGMYLYQVMMTLHFLMTSLMTLNQHKNRKLRHNR